MKKNILIGFVILFLISGFIAVYGTAARIDCATDHCGANCPHGMCAEADDCYGCEIHNCWNPDDRNYYCLLCTNQ